MFSFLRTAEFNSGKTAATKVNALRQFRTSESGSLIIFSLFMLVIMLIVAGMAVDLMRTELNRTRLQATLDRSVLAGAALTQGLDAEAVVLDYFTKAGFGDVITANDITVVKSITGKTVSAAVAIDVQSYFLNLIGIDALKAPAAGEAQESASEIEISLIVDTSNSMNIISASGNSRIDDLKAAAKEFVYLMQCDPEATPPFDGNCTLEPNKISVSLVPYNEYVLAGETLLQQFNTTEEHTLSSCIDFTVSDYDTVAIELDPMVANPSGGFPDLTPNLMRSVALDPNSLGTDATDAGRVCDPDTSRAILPYGNTHLELEAAIDALYAKGLTSIEMGMKWGGALLDPSFRPALANLSNNLGMVHSDFVGRPYDYGTPGTKKIIVLMTDGMNTTHRVVRPEYSEGPSPFYVNHHQGAHAGHVSVYDPTNGKYFALEHSQYRGQPDGGSKATQLSYPEFWESQSLRQAEIAAFWLKLPDAVDYVDGPEKDVHLDAICTAAKDQGITVFTMGFETSAEASLVMQSCASTPSHHYDVDGTDIGVAFHSIARNITTLRLTN
ncbi:MAG: pilus assembly protein TadG-related protein [Paracoccaceae bacterium]